MATTPTNNGRTTMATLNQICKLVVSSSLNADYIQENGTLPQIYWEEYGQHAGITPAACKGYLGGLPSVCTIPFADHEILALLADAGHTRKSESAQQKLTQRYWEICGYYFYKLIE